VLLIPVIREGSLGIQGKHGKRGLPLSQCQFLYAPRREIGKEQVRFEGLPTASAMILGGNCKTKEQVIRDLQGTFRGRESIGRHHEFGGEMGFVGGKLISGGTERSGETTLV